MAGRIIDLHGHTRESDGTLSIPEYVKKANEMGLAAIALTNHDTVDGVEQFMQEGAKYPNLQTISGVELITELPSGIVPRPRKFKFEILGMDIKNLQPLQAYQKAALNLRKNMTLERIRLLNENGVPIKFEDIAYDEHGQLRNVLAKPHVAAYLLEHGHVSYLQEAYDKYLNPGGCAFVCPPQVSIKESCDTIAQSGALRIMAHPRLLNLADEDLYRLVKTLKSEGVIDGIEVMHSSHSFKQMKMYVDMAEELNLFMSGGSDFHGTTKPEVEMGLGDVNAFPKGNIAVPEFVLDSIQTRCLPTKGEYSEMRRIINGLSAQANGNLVSATYKNMQSASH